MNREKLGAYGYVLDLKRDVLVMTSDDSIQCRDPII